MLLVIILIIVAIYFISKHIDKTRIEKFSDHITPRERCCNSVPAGWCVEGCKGGSYGGKSSRNECAPKSPHWIPFDKHASANPKECTNVPTCKVGDTRILNTINKDGGSSPALKNILTKLYNDPLTSPEYNKCYEPICGEGKDINIYTDRIDKLNRDLVDHSNEVRNIHKKKIELTAVKNACIQIRAVKADILEKDTALAEAEEAVGEKGSRTIAAEVNLKSAQDKLVLYIDNIIAATRQLYGPNPDRHWSAVRDQTLARLEKTKKRPYTMTYINKLEEDINRAWAEQTKLLRDKNQVKNNLLKVESCKGFDVSPGKNDLHQCSMSGVDEDKEIPACNKMCQSNLRCKAFVIKNGICYLKSSNDSITLTADKDIASYQPLRGCDSNLWTVKTLVNSYSGNRKNNPHNQVIIPMSGPIGLNNNNTIEYTYTFWLRINRRGDNWRALFRRGPQHPENTRQMGRYPWEESRGPGVWLWPKGHGRDKSIHIMWNATREKDGKRHAWQQGYNIPDNHIEFHKWHHIAFSIKQTQRLKVYVDGKRIYTTALRSPVTYNTLPEWPIIVGGGSEGGYNYVNINNESKQDHWPGFNLRKLQVYRSALSDKYIKSLMKSDIRDGVTENSLYGADSHDGSFEGFESIYARDEARKGNYDNVQLPLVDKGASPPNLSKVKLNRCEGDCDKDDDCLGDLKCFQRSRGDKVPGCAKGGPGDDKNGTYGYCYDPKHKKNEPEGNIRAIRDNHIISPTKGIFKGATKTLVDSIVNHEHINIDSSTTKCKVKYPSQLVYVKKPSTYRDASNYCKSIGRNILSFAGAEGKGGGYGGSMSWVTAHSGQAPDGHLGVRVAKRINDYKLAQVKELVKSQADGSRKTFSGGGIWVGTNDKKREQAYINPDGQLGPIPENNHRQIVRGSGIGNPTDRIDIQGFYPCQNWSKQSPHKHGLRTPNDNKFITTRTGPGGEWCYTTDPNNRWNYNNPNSQAPLWFAHEPNNWGYKPPCTDPATCKPVRGAEGGENCVHLTRWGAEGTPTANSAGIRLNDIRCNYKLPFVCEKEIDDPTSLGSNACMDLPPYPDTCAPGTARGNGELILNSQAKGDGWERRTSEPGKKWCSDKSCYNATDGQCYTPFTTHKVYDNK